MTEAPTTPPRHDPKIVTALRRFAISITVLNIAGYTVLGFEQPWLWPILAVAVGYTVETVLEYIGARVEKRRPRFAGGGAKGVLEFLYPSHITALAVNMLLYVNDRLWVMVLGVVIAVSAKWVLRAPVRGRPRHFMNPSNFGIAVVLLLFPWASIAPPYQFTEYTDGAVDWIIPAVIVALGTLLNAKLTGRMWLIGGWLVVFVLQAVLRGVLFDTAIPPALGMMTGVAFVLFTNYMVTDPGTTPSRPVAQVAFGGGVAVTYGIMTGLGIAYGLFFATAVVCLVRGGYLWLVHLRTEQAGTSPAPVPAVEARGVPSESGKAPVAA